MLPHYFLDVGSLSKRTLRDEVLLSLKIYNVFCVLFFAVSCCRNSFIRLCVSPTQPFRSVFLLLQWHNLFLSSTQDIICLTLTKNLNWKFSSHLASCQIIPKKLSHFSLPLNYQPCTGSWLPSKGWATRREWLPILNNGPHRLADSYSY